MSKRALEAGLKRYPERIIGHTKSLLCPSELVDVNVGKRIVFMEGYMQAEKDTLERIIGYLGKRDLEHTILDFDKYGYAYIDFESLEMLIRKTMEDE